MSVPLAPSQLPCARPPCAALPSSAPIPETHWQVRIGECFLCGLAALLVVYALAGRSIADFVPAIGHSETAVLVLGLVALVCSRRWSRLGGNTLFWLILAMMLWAEAWMLAGDGVAGMGVLRGAANSGDAVLAIIVASLLIDQPQRLATLYVRFARVVPIALWAGPILLVLSQARLMPRIDSGCMVHLCAATAMLVASPALAGRASVLILLPVALAGCVTGSAGLTTFSASLLLMVALRPGNRMVWRLTGIAAMVVGVLWVIQTSINPADGTHSQLSNLLASPIPSLLDAGAHFAMATHSGTIGVALWIAVQLTWAGRMISASMRAFRHRDTRWAGVFMVLLVYWTALAVSSAVGIGLDGPAGGLWFWTIIGVGMAAEWIHRYRPDVLYPPQAVIRAPSAAPLMESAPPPRPRRPSAYAVRLLRRRPSSEMRPAPVRISISAGSK